MDLLTTHISKNAGKYIKKVLETTYLSEGKEVRKFENKLTEKYGLINPTAVNSGTSALHLALLTAGIQRGDEVITTPQTFIATGLAILMQGAKPVFADIQYKTGNICPKSILAKITKRTKAIIPVHWLGYPCDMDEINSIAKANNLIVIEDAAQAFGAFYKNRPIGSISPFTAFSFQATKHLTTGDGGALCCLDNLNYEKANTLRWFGIDRKNSKPTLLGEREYDLKTLGYKYHMNNYAAALGLANLEDVQASLDRRREIAEIYFHELKNVSGLELLEYNNDRVPSYWLFALLVEDRINFIKKLKAEGIPSNVMHLRIDKNSIFGGEATDLINMEKYNNMQINIPVHQGLTDADVDHIIKVIKSGW